MRPNFVAALQALPEGCRRFTEDNSAAFFAAPGSSANHQAWHGGYADHLDEVFGIATRLYVFLDSLRDLPFRVEDALYVLFLHDAEKVFKRLPADVDRNTDLQRYAESDPATLRELILGDYGLPITDEQDNALKYVHGELDDYRSDQRVAGPLGAFCHCCDYISARIWFDEPRKTGSL